MIRFDMLDTEFYHETVFAAFLELESAGKNPLMFTRVAVDEDGTHRGQTIILHD